MTFEEIWNQIKDIEGWMGIEDAQVLYGYASKTKGLIVEIGCYAGRSTKLLALSSPESKILAIDSFKLGDSDRIRSLFYENIRGLNVELMNETSQKVGKDWEKQIDMLVVDGGHSYFQVKKDIRLFVPHVRGVALFHDYVGYGIKDEAYGVLRALNKSGLPVEKESGFAAYKP